MELPELSIWQEGCYRMTLRRTKKVRTRLLAWLKRKTWGWLLLHWIQDWKKPGQEGLSIYSQNQVKLIRKNLNISLHYTHGENTRYLNWCTSLITSVQSLHVPEVMRHHDTMRNTVLGRGVTNVSQRQIGETLAYKLPELPKGVGFLKRKPKLHSQLLFPVLTTQVG